MQDIPRDPSEHAQITASQQLASIKERTPGHDEYTEYLPARQVTDNLIRQAMEPFNDQKILLVQCNDFFRLKILLVDKSNVAATQFVPQIKPSDQIQSICVSISIVRNPGSRRQRKPGLSE